MQGATSENTGSMWVRSNAAARAAAPAECRAISRSDH